MTPSNYINHIALVLDASSSMNSLKEQVIAVADKLTKYLAQRSQELDQETRITVYKFGSGKAQCLFYDKDVLRLPSLKGLYTTQGMTALIDATLLAIDEMSRTATLHGEHAFLTYVITDGQENDSKHKGNTLADTISNLPDNWTLATFVPDQNGVFEAKKFGFPAGNIAVWDTKDSQSVEKVGETIIKVTNNYMMARASGVKSYKNLFQIDTKDLSQTTIKKLNKLGPGQFRLLKVKDDTPISTFVEHHTGRAYKLGEAFYELSKKETIQPQKEVAIYARNEHAVYTGKDARTLLKLPADYEVKVAPADHPDYDIYVQSTSTNRKLIKGTKLLLLS